MQINISWLSPNWWRMRRCLITKGSWIRNYLMMGERKRLSQDLHSLTFTKCTNGTGYRRISKPLNVSVSTAGALNLWKELNIRVHSRGPQNRNGLKCGRMDQNHTWAMTSFSIQEASWSCHHLFFSSVVWFCCMCGLRGLFPMSGEMCFYQSHLQKYINWEKPWYVWCLFYKLCIDRQAGQ